MAGTTGADYHQLADRLAEFSLSPAEAQGVLCGLLCCPVPGVIDLWLDELVGKQPGTASLRTDLAAAAEQTQAEVAGVEPSFGLWLPDEDQSLTERVIAAYDWGRGFVYGLGLAGVSPADLSPVAREILQDFIAITELDLDDPAPDEEREQALTEITEFIRVAAMIVYGDCKAGTAPKAGEH